MKDFFTLRTIGTANINAFISTYLVYQYARFQLSDELFLMCGFAVEMSFDKVWELDVGIFIERRILAALLKSPYVVSVLSYFVISF